MSLIKPQIGYTVHFTTTHFREGRKTAKRKIVAICNGVIGVRMFGFNPYWLDRVGSLDKIHSIEK